MSLAYLLLPQRTGGTNTMKCPHCGKEINPASLLGQIKSEKKSAASRENGKAPCHPGKKRGRPKKPASEK